MRERVEDPGLRVCDVRPPAGTGVANETLIFEVERSSGESEGYVARLATPDPLYLDDELERHYRMYETMMSNPSIPTPAVLGFEADSSKLGAQFFVMERVEGLVPADSPSWATTGFIFDAEPAQRRALCGDTVRVMADLHGLEVGPFEFLRSRETSSGIGDCLEYWRRSLRWAGAEDRVPLVGECEAWLLENMPELTGLSWGDSRLPNVIYRDFHPVALLDWDLVSLAGPQADLAWWIIMDPPESRQLEGVGSPQELVDRWEELTGQPADRLRWYLVFGAYRLAAILAKLFSMMAAKGHMSAEQVQAALVGGSHVGLIAGLLDLTPPPGVVPLVPELRLEG
jgi:aminoglycoside phosphotransferase (APT) family kinase protein